MKQRTRRLFAIFAVLILMTSFATTALADCDPLQVVDNLSASSSP
jgi:hypothetical protein